MSNDSPQTVEEYFVRAGDRFSGGDVEGAIADYTEAIRLNPNNPDAWHKRGIAWSQKSEHDKAIVDHTKAISLNRNHSAAWNGRGIAWRGKGEYDKAISDMNEAIQLAPVDVDYWINRGIFWSDKSEHDKAIADHTKAISLNRNHFAAWNGRGIAWLGKREYDRALSDLNEAIRLVPGDADFWINRGNAWHEKGEYEKAIEDYSQAIRLRPDYALAFSNRGNSWSAKGEYDKALHDLNEAIRLTKSVANFWVNRGNFWHTKGNYDKAIEDYSQAIRLRPDYALAFSNRGNSWSAKREYDKAIEDCKEALSLNPGDSRTKHIMNISQRKKDEQSKINKERSEDTRFTSEEKQTINEQTVANAVQATELERREIAESIKKEYSEQLGKKLETAVEQIEHDTKEFRKDHRSNLRYSNILRVLAMFFLAITAVWVVGIFWFIHYHFLAGGTLGNWGLIAWIPVVTVISTPFVVIWWMLQRWSFELKTLAYGFQRKAILEERILLFFRNDPERLKEMQKLYVVHWMEKSPLEVMLAINGKGKNIGRENSSASALLKEMLDSVSKIIGKDDNPLSS